MERTAAIGRELLGWRKLVPAIISVILGGLLFSSTGRDDAYITYWVAEMLARHGEIVNYNAERVEQSSSLAHVLLLAGLSKQFPLSMPTIGALVSIVFGAATVVLTQKLAVAVNPRISDLAGLLAAFSPSLLYWSFGGLETTLAAFLSVGLLQTYIHGLQCGLGAWSLLTVCLTTALYLMVRPESIAVISLALFGVIVLLLVQVRTLFPGEDIHKDQLFLKRGAVLMSVVAMLWAALVLFRFVYFEGFFPQPVAAKSSGLSLSRFHDGIAYLRVHAFNRFGLAFWLLAACGVVMVFYRKIVGSARVSVAELVIGMFVVAHTAFIIAAGGDWMEGGRFLVPLVPMGAIMALYLVSQLNAPKAFTAVGLLLGCLQLSGAFYLARYQSTGGPLWSTLQPRELSASSFSWFERANRIHLRDIAVIPRLNDLVHRLRLKQSRPVSIMSGQMGMVAYHISLNHFGAVRFIDGYGLATKDFISCRVTQPLPRGSTGLILPYAFFFENRKQLAQQCNLDDPEIIFDISGPDTVEVLRRNGYSIIYQQSGSISNGSQWFPGAAVSAGEFIALRNDLAKSLWASGTRFEVRRWPSGSRFEF